MAISKIVYKSSPSAAPEVWMDATTATAAAADIASPKTAMLADGVMTEGTGTGGGGGSKNVQIAFGCSRVNRTASLAYVTFNGQALTVAKTGIYDVYWFSVIDSGTNTIGYGTSLYIDGVAYGNSETTFSEKGQAVHLSEVSLTEGQRVTLRGTTPSTNYGLYGGNLTLIET